MKLKAKRFYSSGEDFRQFHLGLKQTSCPHCKSTGFLNLHGYLRGHDEFNYGLKIIRGRRIFCSNRGRRKGCGKTFSILAAEILKKFVIGAKSLWRFLRNIAAGLNTIESFRTSGLKFSHSTCYRLAKAFQRAQSKIRSKLLSICPAPCSLSKIAGIQTISHLRAAFRYAACPVFSFQQFFQSSFL